ncbi:MazG family protein [Meiothermus granaticius]|uniref:Nucleoside triphosphate pyrophosphohydrolase n=1 Tax=Meiothermus granaticius NBRC 107808 TaxID=1227551 RepID=A0A399F841_9DEIN|nr:MazG family protein [Meiothermus granaticius]MCL6525568.1 MazG family protein [Thermaceae bacterium]RIH91429.1 Nucleoside triphosphate pyrophosphohydrolase [Meiothermus granaticius NBRC 107808]GEM87882.1 nucleoside triphosphate pyrophosphohydrolase [Meiothermus granaticius NBRC 107808]
MERLLEVMRRLRAPDGCPWDKEQTHLSLRPYMLEEAAEAVDAMSSGNPAELAEELGDVLLQVAFHSVIGEQEGTFGYPQVEQHIVDKLIRRHPHVFGQAQAHTPEQVTANWQAIKRAEGKAQRSLCDQVPRSLGALARAAELQRKLELPGGSEAQVIEALNRGDLAEALWQLVALARREKLNPEVVLRERCEQVCA